MLFAVLQFAPGKTSFRLFAVHCLLFAPTKAILSSHYHEHKIGQMDSQDGR